LSQLEGVIRVHPNGLNGKALVYVSDKKKVGREEFEKAFAGDKELSVRKVKTIKG
jgi:hypothetical protein